METKDKRSFVLYYSLYEEVIKKLNDHQIADLVRAIFSTGGVCEKPELDMLTDMAFGPIERELRMNNEKWLATCKARAEAGRKGGYKKAENARKAKAAALAKLANVAEDDADADAVAVADADAVAEADAVVEAESEAEANNTTLQEAALCERGVSAAGAAAGEFFPSPSVSQNSPSMREVEAHFEALWQLYPNKRGKKEVSQRVRRKLMAVSVETMQRAIARYTAELEEASYARQWLNGSTWFNGRYEDYLDEVYTPAPKVQPKPVQPAPKSARGYAVQMRSPEEEARNAAYYASIEE